MSDHLWYLNEELAALALFDENVSIEVKKMCEAIQSRESTTVIKKRYIIDEKTLELF